MVDALIVGGGLAGLTLGLECRKRSKSFRIVEPAAEVGGLCQSYTHDGWSFDYGPHIFCPACEEAEDWFADLCSGDYFKRERNDCVLVDGTEYRYPIQSSLAADVAGDGRAVANYRDYVLSHFGQSLYDRFFEPYNKKLWKRDLANLSAELLGGRSPAPDAKPQHYLYPRRGMRVVAEELLRRIGASNVTRGEVEIILPKTKVAVLSTGEHLSYQKLVWCAPLPALARVLKDKSSAWRFDLLQEQPIFLISVWLKRRLPQEWLALYVPHPKYVFHRLSIPTVLSPVLAPPGSGSIQCEVAVHRDDPVEIETDVVAPTLSGLSDLGLMDRGEEKGISIRLLHNGYPVPTLGSAHVTDAIENGLREMDILLCGRAGRWRHMNIWPVLEDARRVGEALAQ